VQNKKGEYEAVSRAGGWRSSSELAKSHKKGLIHRIWCDKSDIVYLIWGISHGWRAMVNMSTNK
jgi:hypothetical protein